ncbi:MAG: polysaccharide biosynthesis C-terminal domain-containing protein [Flavobacteriales bacterium]|nr:polysaccharide biosynthesis C-terminal domain-containing protein [Flavobacteriales bacterium]
MRSLTGNILRTFSTQVPSLIISIISGIFLTRLLGAEGKGVYAIFYANIEIMVMIFVMGCDLGIVYYGSNKKISIGKLQGIAAYILLISIPFVALIIIFLETDFLFPDNYNSLFFKLFLLGMFILRLVNSLIGAFLKTAKSFKYINRISLINSIFNVSTYSLLFYLNSKGIIDVDIQFIFTTSISILLINTLMWLFSFKKSEIIFLPAFKLSFKKDIKPFFGYIFPVFISLVINFLNYRFDIWLVSYYNGYIQLGIYVLAVNFAQFILLYSRIIGSVMMPYLSEDNDEQRRKYFTTYSRINFTSVVLIVIFLAIIGEWLLGFLYGKEFASSAGPFNILLIGMVFTAMSQLFSIMLFSKGKNNVALVANSVGLIATILFDVLLIPKYGIIGAAAATSISYFLLFLVLLYYLLQKEKLKFSEIFIVKKSDFIQIFQKD